MTFTPRNAAEAGGPQGYRGQLESQIPGSIPAHDPPAWFDEFSSALAYADHLVLSGNTRDLYPVSADGRQGFLDLTGTLRILLARRGIREILLHDPAGGLTIAAPHSDDAEEALRAAGVPIGTPVASLGELAEIHARITGNRDLPVALVIEYATHLHGRSPEDLEDFFIAIDKASRAPGGLAATGQPRNPTIWVADHPADLPDWFVVGNDLLREVQLEYPNLEDRFLFARRLAHDFGWDRTCPAAEQQRYLQQLALECDGETLVAMHAVARVAADEGIGLSRISDAIRIHRTGSRRNPWASPVLFDRVRQARTRLEERIKGQPFAIEKTLDILARSIMGLSGSQTGSRHHKPRGVLFFAGPTGVGKTELAKAVTELLFGDESACHRFDMSEFMEEASISRLIGAPPGHPGHERGGELVNAAHRHPFSVFLFDEIEKAHPRILDMFLQILDEGRLTDARGATAHFSQALIVFTSNIGVVGGASTTNMGMSVLPSDSHVELEAKIIAAVQDHFRTKLRRPELVSRIGQNIVVFDFLSPASAVQIFDAILQRVVEAVRREHGIRVEFSEQAYRELKLLCVHDHFEGGRGVGNRVETHFINPLSRLLFDARRLADLRVTDAVTEKGMTRLAVEWLTADHPPAPEHPPHAAPRRVISAGLARHGERTAPHPGRRTGE